MTSNFIFHLAILFPLVMIIHGFLILVNKQEPRVYFRKYMWRRNYLLRAFMDIISGLALLVFFIYLFMFKWGVVLNISYLAPTAILALGIEFLRWKSLTFQNDLVFKHKVAFFQTKASFKRILFIVGIIIVLVVSAFLLFSYLAFGR